MLSDKMEKLWNEFSNEEKEAIEACYQTLRAEYMTLQEILDEHSKDGNTEALKASLHNISKI